MPGWCALWLVALRHSLLTIRGQLSNPGPLEIWPFNEQSRLSWNNNNNNRDDIYGAVIMASHCESSPGSFDECKLITGWSPTPDQGNQLGLCIHHCHLLLLSPKSDTRFTVPWRVEGWVEIWPASRQPRITWNMSVWWIHERTQISRRRWCYLHSKFIAERARSTILIQRNPSFVEMLDQVHFSCRLQESMLKSNEIWLRYVVTNFVSLRTFWVPLVKLY